MTGAVAAVAIALQLVNVNRARRRWRCSASASAASTRPIRWASHDGGEHERAAGELDSQGVQGDGQSIWTDVSRDGRLVAFDSFARIESTPPPVMAPDATLASMNLLMKPQ